MLLQQSFWAGQFSPFNLTVTMLAKGNQIIKLISCFVVSIELTTRFYVMYVNNAFLVPCCIHSAYLARFPVTLQRFAPLNLPIWATILIVSALIIWMICAALLFAECCVATLMRTITPIAFLNIKLMHRKRFSAPSAGDCDCIQRRFMVRVLTSFGTEAARFLAYPNDEGVMAVIADYRFMSRFYIAFFGAVDSPAKFEVFAALWTSFNGHLAPRNAISHDVCGQRGTSAAFSGISLDHKPIIPQIEAVR